MPANEGEILMPSLFQEWILTWKETYWMAFHAQLIAEIARQLAPNCALATLL